MSSMDSATRRAFLRDIFGRILDDGGLPPQAVMEAYTAMFNWITAGPRHLRLGDDALAREVYNFVRDSLAEHIRPKVNKAEARDVPKLAPPTAGALKASDGVCRYLRRQYIAPRDLEEVSAFALRTFREAAVEKIQSDPQLLSDWLQGDIDGVRQGIEPSDDVKAYGLRILEIFEVCADDYATRVSMPFIRDAVALYHEKAKTLVADNAFEVRKAEILAMETRRAEVYLHESHRSDYVATINELFGLGDEKFQRR